MGTNIAVKIQNYNTARIGDDTVYTIQIVKSIMAGKLYPDINNKSKKYLIICGDSDIDAILACPFAMYMEKLHNANCPILLTKSGNQFLFKSISDLLDNRWSTSNDDLFKEIYVIGGDSAIPDNCIGFKNVNMTVNGDTYERKSGKTRDDYVKPNAQEDEDKYQLLRYTEKVIRIHGRDRYRTSYKLASTMSNPSPNYLFFCSGKNFVDGYSIATAASYLRCPLLLLPENYNEDTKTQGAINQALTNFLELDNIQSSVKKVFIAGGSQSNFIEAEEAIRSELGLVMPNSVERIAGQDRYDTSLSIAKEFKDFLESPNPYPYPRNQILPNEMECSKLIIIGGSSDVINCPIAPVFAVKYKCPLIVNNYLLKPRLIKGYLNNNKFYRDSAHTSEITIGDATDTKFYAVFKDEHQSDKYYRYQRSQFEELSGYPTINSGYKNGNNFYQYCDKTTDPPSYTDLITPNHLDYYIDLPTTSIYYYDDNNQYVVYGQYRIDTSPAPRTYNIMSYLQIKRPQLIYCFTDYAVEKDINSFSGQQFENLVQFYNGEIKISGQTDYDINIISLT